MPDDEWRWWESEQSKQQDEIDRDLATAQRENQIWEGFRILRRENAYTRHAINGERDAREKWGQLLTARLFGFTGKGKDQGELGRLQYQWELVKDFGKIALGILTTVAAGLIIWAITQHVGTGH